MDKTGGRIKGLDIFRDKVSGFTAGTDDGWFFQGY
jgi:hypothetical protein